MKIFGHPLHPALVHFPIVCWLLPVPCDVALYVTGDVFWARAATWLLGVGVAMGSLAAIAGMADLGQLKKRPEAETTVSTHIVLMLGAFSAATVSLVGRLKLEQTGLAWPSYASAAGAVMVLAGALFGGSLVYKFGFGRDVR